MYKLEKGWAIDPSKKIIFKKSIPIISWLLTSLGCTKTSMRDLYSMVVRGFSKSELMKYVFPLDHDNFLKPLKYPIYFRLDGGWKIEPKSIKFLKNGPLFSEDGTDDIVPAKIFTRSVLMRIIKFIVAVGVTLVSLASGIITIYLFLKQIRPD